MAETVDMEKLINEIQKRPAIWNMKTVEYSNKTKKRNAWEEIINIFSNESATNEEKKILGKFVINIKKKVNISNVVVVVTKLLKKNSKSIKNVVRFTIYQVFLKIT